MQENKVVRLLKSFSKEELKDFGRFISSPYHNNRTELYKYFLIMKKQVNESEKKPLNKEKIFEQMYPKQNFNALVIDRNNSYLLKLGHDFLVFNSLKKDPYDFKLRLLKQLDYHKLDADFEKELQETRIFIDNKKLNSKTYTVKRELEAVTSNFYVDRNRQQQIVENTFKRGEYTVLDFINKFIMDYQGMSFNKVMFNYAYRDSILNVFLRYFDFSGFNNEINNHENNHYQNFVNYNFYKLMSLKYPEQDCNYKKYKEYSFKDIDELDEAEIMERFNNLSSYSAFQSRTINSQYLKEHFLLHKEALEKNYINFNSKDKSGYEGFLENFINISLLCREPDYTENLIDNYGKYLPGEFKDDLSLISRARICIARNEYQNALAYLNKVNMKKFRNILPVKMLTITIYYEIYDYNLFCSQVDSLRHYLSREKRMLDRAKSTILTCTNYLVRLAKFKSDEQFEELFTFRKAVEQEQNLLLIDKILLYEKIDKLEEIHKRMINV